MSKKSLLKISSGDIRSMAGDSGFKSWSKGKGLDIDSMSKSSMQFNFMKYLKSKGQ